MQLSADWWDILAVWIRYMYIQASVRASHGHIALYRPCSPSWTSGFPHWEIQPLSRVTMVMVFTFPDSLQSQSPY